MFGPDPGVPIAYRRIGAWSFIIWKLRGQPTTSILTGMYTRSIPSIWNRTSKNESQEIALQPDNTQRCVTKTITTWHPHAVLRYTNSSTWHIIPRVHYYRSCVTEPLTTRHPHEVSHCANITTWKSALRYINRAAYNAAIHTCKRDDLVDSVAHPQKALH